MTSTRIYFMDPLRGVLMALGVVLHAAQVFNPEFNWLIQSPLPTDAAPYIVSVIHLFRMPAFYIVSGFFALLTLQKYRPNLFLQLRAEKILIPFVVTAVTLNSFQAWMLHRYQGGTSSFDFSGYFWDGAWVSHLWFLGYLFLYILLIYFAALIATSVRAKFLRNFNWLNWMGRLPIEVVLLLLPIYYLALVVFGKVFPAIFVFRLGFSLYDAIYFFQFFIFGFVLFWKPSLLAKFTRVSIVKIGLLLAFWAALYNHHQWISSETLSKVIEAYSRLLIVWISCHLVFSAFKTLVDRPSKLAAFTSSVSYSVYLFHHSLIILFGILLIQMGIGGLLGFLILAAVVSALGVLIHVGFVSKFEWASFLFNGVRLRRLPEAQSKN